MTIEAGVAEANRTTKLRIPVALGVRLSGLVLVALLVNVGMNWLAFSGAAHAPAWQPILLIVAGLAIVAATIAFELRRRLAPMAALTKWAQAAAEGKAATPEIHTGDDWAVLGAALQRVNERLEAARMHARKLAYVDPITELPNTEHCTRVVSEALAGRPAAEESAALLLVSLDRLSRLGETLGPEAMHELLAIAGQRMSSAIRTIDRMVRLEAAEAQPSLPARLAGNEFAVFVPTLLQPSDAARFAQLVAAALAQPVEWRHHKVEFGCAVGVAVLPHHGQDAESAIRNARLAVNAARGEHKPIRFFTRSLDREVSAKINLERAMREGLERNEFRAYFQPKINLATGRTEACEALARWTRGDKFVAGPGRFIPLAEENGLIDDIAAAILRDACWKAAAWARQGWKISVAVNVSALQFQDDRFATRILKLLEQADLAPHLLELEVTESVAMRNVDRVLDLVTPLRDRGVRFAIDDFGTGHSSLGVLSRLPFDVLKVDQSFVRGLGTDRYAPAIVETILGMAASLDFETVAEGVETSIEADFLRMRGCSFAQGFLYGAAMPPAEFLERLRREGDGLERPIPARRAGVG